MFCICSLKDVTFQFLCWTPKFSISEIHVKKSHAFCGTEPINKCWYDLYFIGVYSLESLSVYIENEATVIFQKSELSS